MLDVGELHLQAGRAAAAVAEVHLAEALGGDAAQLLLTGAGVVGVEEAGRVLRGQGEGEAADAGVVGGAGRGGEPEPGPGVDDDAASGGCLLAGLGADAGLPAGADRVLKASAKVRAGPAELVLDAPRSTVRWVMPSRSATARVPLSCLTTLPRNSPAPSGTAAQSAGHGRVAAANRFWGSGQGGSCDLTRSVRSGCR
ncbi:hypothetical protein JL475_31920 [Streptomyces sp. M2CJ-2]|nr:hypothetical protein [Streptomyces sp. M2CJ-2]